VHIGFDVIINHAEVFMKVLFFGLILSCVYSVRAYADHPTCPTGSTKLSDEIKVIQVNKVPVDTSKVDVCQAVSYPNYPNCTAPNTTSLMAGAKLDYNAAMAELTAVTGGGVTLLKNETAWLQNWVGNVTRFQSGSQFCARCTPAVTITKVIFATYCKTSVD